MLGGLRSCLVVLGSVGLLSAAVLWRGPTTTPADAPLPAASGAPRFYKGNLHTHTFWSDGDHFPEMVADWYKQHGYDFLSLTDHNVLSEGERWIDAGAADSARAKALEKYRARFGDSWVERRTEKDKAQVRLKPLREFRSLFEEPGRFLLVPGEEVTHKYAKAPVHMNAINLRDVIAPLDGDSVAETARVNLRAIEGQRKKTGWKTIAIINHPNFQWGVRAEDLVMTDELRFFEVQNGHPGVRNYGDDTHASCERIWDVLLALRLGKHRLGVVYGVGTDDAHAYHTFAVGKTNPGRAWVMVRAPYLSAEAIVRAMEQGDFYASSGVVLDDVARKINQLRLSIKGEPGVTYRTEFVATMRDASFDSQPMRDAEGKPLDVTRVYSADVGKVVATVEGLTPTYTLTGKELYVRARVLSTKPHPNPFQKGDVEMAWTQPILP